MRAPSSIIAEGLAYVFIALLAAVVISHAGRTPGEAVSPDLRIAEAGR